MSKTFCAITTKYIANPEEGGANIEVKVATCVKLNELVQDNNGLCEAVGLCPIEKGTAMTPQPIIEYESSYNSAARRGILGKMGFQIQAVDFELTYDTFGRPYKTNIVYSLGLPVTQVAQRIVSHEWVFGDYPKSHYKTVPGSVVQKIQKKTNPTFA